MSLVKKMRLTPSSRPVLAVLEKHNTNSLQLGDVQCKMARQNGTGLVETTAT
jgi:hypothetical protein